MAAESTGPLRLQKRLLLVGAALDAAFAVPMLVAPVTASRLLDVTLPEPRTWFHLAAVLLLIAAGAYLVGACTDAATQPIALVAGCGRILGCVILAYAFLEGQGAVFVVVATADGALGLAHLVACAARRPGGRVQSP